MTHASARRRRRRRDDWPAFCVAWIAACGARDAPTVRGTVTQTQAVAVDTKPSTPLAAAPGAAIANSDAVDVREQNKICSTEAPSTDVELTRFAVIGDYGQAGAGEQLVAKLVKSWDPEFIITVGDNNYTYGEAATIDNNIGYYFREYICPYVGRHGAGAKRNRFFPALGNHDWYAAGAQPYLDYFTLPGNERYYDMRWGNVHVFVLDTDEREPDGVEASSAQAKWLAKTASASKAPWQLVTGHHPPYSSSSHGNALYMQWPFKDYGIDLALFGHDHSYERLVVGDLTYIVNGLGGRSLYPFATIVPESLFRFNETLGAQLIEASKTKLTSKFYDIQGNLIDEFTLDHK
jgi:tartrate-resistant acid phosphatase type 5